jgi:tetratricopeptide (TPR) repeat protein
VNAAPYFTAAQFATPTQILAMRAPDARLPYPTAMRHYARALARAQQRNRIGFEQELAKLRAIRTSDALQPMIEQGAPAGDLLDLAETVARARWAGAHARWDEAARLYREAIVIEQKMPYIEPPFWYFPVHQSLGAILYRAGRHREASEAFTTALAQSPNNGWALYGLAASERALGRRDEARTASSAFKKAWSGNRAWLRMDRL